MPATATVPGYPIAPDDPRRDDAHAVVAAWVEEVLRGRDAGHSLINVDLKSSPAGRRMVDSPPATTRRLALAAATQAEYWECQKAALRDRLATTDAMRSNPHMLPGWYPMYQRQWQARTVARTLLRRALPFDEADLLRLVDWCRNAPGPTATYLHPVKLIVRALERFAAAHPVGPELREAIRGFAARLRDSFEKECQRLATPLEQLCGPAEGEGGTAPVAPATPVAAPAIRPAPEPAPAGHPLVLRPLKEFLGMIAAGEGPASTIVGVDRYALIDGSPLRAEHEWIGELLAEILAAGRYYHSIATLTDCVAGRDLLSKDLTTAGRVVLAAMERHDHHSTGRLLPDADHRSLHTLGQVVPLLLRAGFEVDRAGFFDLLLDLGVHSPTANGLPGLLDRTLLDRAETEAAAAPLAEGERYVLLLVRVALVAGPALGRPSAAVDRLTRLIGDGANFFLAPGDVVSDAANAELTAAGPKVVTAWGALLAHALSATGARPSTKWRATGSRLVAAIGADEVQATLLRWFPLVAQGRTLRSLSRHARVLIRDENATAIRGLIWLVPTLPRPAELVRSLTAVALWAYKKVPGVGPQAVKVGNAAVAALAEIGTPEAVGQLALLRVRVKTGSAQKEIDKAFAAAAAALGLPGEEIEELGVPTYGLEEVGRRSGAVGDYRAELVVAGSAAALRWSDGKGKALKAVPAAVKRAHKDELREWREALQDVAAMLPAQRDRLDGLFLAQKSWPLDAWRERYADHPLVGTIARRLIWQVDARSVLFRDGTPTDALGRPVAIEPGANVSLWHPVGRTPAEVVGWRRRLEALGVTQPFKQAHREVYPLTDAERNTRTYSNRFAAHVIRQHQFHALCAARGWKNQLRLMVDNSYAPPSKDLPGWGLRAEFWVEGIGDDYGTDTNDTGTYLRLSTDQVRFYRTGAATNEAHAGGGGYESAVRGPGPDTINEPIPLDQVPPLVFSEVMRDVDLFVGVASVGNDPTWQDGGPQGRYRAYWQGYSFGELSGTAATRKQVLERLVPRLKIAKQCSLEDRFLRVEGTKRAYRIHLGSGNILMEPDDRYLCIVPDGRARAGPTDLFLPFEGDNMLSIILSKALLLADDARIKDPTILSQINHR